MSTITVQPAEHECVIVHAPPGTTIRVERPGTEAREYPDRYSAILPEEQLPVSAVIWAPVFGGAAITTYLTLRAVRNGHHQRDRNIWHQAVQQVRKAGVVYVNHELRDWYGRPAWVAAGFRVVTREENSNAS